MTLTEPRVSTVFRDLHRILFFRMRLAVMVREAVSAMGSPSGMKAIATETHPTMRRGTLIHPGCSVRRYAALEVLVGCEVGTDQWTNQTITTIAIETNMIEQITMTKLKTSFSRGVKPVFGALVIFAILPKTVISPVATTTPKAEPEMQWVPWRPIHFVSR